MSNPKKIIKNAGFVLYVSMLCRAAKQYIREIIYFLRAKRRYINGAGLGNNPSLVLRKRTHHLERYLFSPDNYTADFAQDAAADIEKILKSVKDIPAGQAQWSQKILDEFRNRSNGGTAPICPLLKNDAVRKQSSISPESLMELLRSRRSRRVFINEPLTEAEKTAICEAAQYAPSSCNRQTIYLLFIEEPQLKEFAAATVPGGYQFFSKAPCILLLLSDAGITPAFILADVICDIVYFVDDCSPLDKKELLSFVKEVLDYNLQNCLSGGLIPYNDGGDFAHIDSQVDFAVSLRRYSELSGEKFYKDKSIDLMRKLLELQYSPEGYFTYSGKIEKNVIDPKYNALLLKGFANLITIEKPLYPQYYSLFKDR